ncbi:alpha-2-macroglobulin family protein [Flavobacterium lacisediminis]|uniref:MG2 domain-containing protein n=1 Tax=Flavobacterium lacisediminis TaxID=2989705 RepID=A0ABT3EH69_9FLAO|nr:alpha-2-macroglobulin family protein [Flavobacterium lacisediminis]MCW1147928.1 MG2 domain-containing protein [Flavobacterium lacisediminis]
MKFKILLFSLLISTFSFSQNFEEQWKEVMQLELDGKTKSADEIVTKIYKKANRKNIEPEIIKCFFYKSKFLQVLDENASEKIVLDIRKEIKKASKPSKGILNYIYAQLLTKYLNKNATNIYKRTPIQDNTSQDFLTWSLSEFHAEIEKAYDESIKYKAELRQTSVKDYKEIFEISPYLDGANYSLYDFLSDKYVSYFGSKTNFWEIKSNAKYEELVSLFYGTTSDFIKLKGNEFNQKSLEKLVTIFQEKEFYALSQKKDLSDIYVFNRIQFFHNNFNSHKPYINSLTFLLKSNANEDLKQDIRVKLAYFYYINANKTVNKDYFIKALELTEEVLSNNNNNNALSNATSIKNTILGKSLSITLNKVLYPNQNARALVYFKNIDSIKISYYRFPVEYDFWLGKPKKVKDSLINNFISKNKPTKSYFKVLPNKGDYYANSTEILLEKIDSGNYLVVLTPEKMNEDEAPILSYENIFVTNIIFHKEYSDKTDDFFIYDRKTGKPYENIIVRNNEQTILSNKDGKASFAKRNYNKNESKESKLFFIKDTDTISSFYTKSELDDNDYSDDYEYFDAKANVFFDRAIYRPGQKVHYKGVMLQKKDRKKSVVPFVTVKVTIEDSNNNTLNEYEVQTNGFGSFSGEFEIPKNILNGEFSLHIEEPDNFENDKKYYDEKEDEHRFWDNVDFEEKWEGFPFRVEEYKRPTFEIKFDEVKECYTIGDTLKISGNVKTLAGSNVSGAKVVWNINKDVYMTEYYSNQESEIITIENITDENGNFSISLIATDSILKNDEIRNINYEIEVAITDLNGETKEAEKYVRVGQETLEISASIKHYLYKEEKNSLVIKAENLNGYQVPTKGEITFYEIKNKEYLFKRQFQFPETQTMSRTEFETLFPNEPYNERDIAKEKKLVKTISFDTKDGNSIDLNFLKDLKNGSYTFTISALDIKKDTVAYESEFKLNSKVEIKSKEKLFTYKIDSKSKDFVTIEFQSEIPNLYITTRAYENDKKYYFETIQLINGKAILKVNKTRNHEKEYYYHFVTFYENYLHHDQQRIDNLIVDNNLELEIVNIRNKVEPGSIENWSFKIKNQKLESEVLASMYDSSLDLFAKKNWENTFFRNQTQYPNFPNLYELNSFENQIVCEFKFTSVFSNYTIQRIDNPQINWYGFEYLYISNDWEQRKYQKVLEAVGEIPENANLITGVISDELGPIAGVNVVVQGTTRGTTTDFDGNFEIFALKGEVLVFTYTGKKTLTQVINAHVVNAALTDDVVSGRNIEVIGAIGIKRKQDAVTSSNQIISGEELFQDSDQNVIQSLAGKVSGLTIETTNNGVNSSTRIVLRGNRSISGNNAALVVIDGVISDANTLQNLKPEDIHETSVLKGAQGAALYGEQGVNGVIIVTTKQGLQQVAQVKTRTNFNETAFFYPHLTTDSEGKVNFKFTTPESLTKWKLRMYAHNKKAETGYLEADIISQKDLMIMPNMPRFVRENDSITVTAKVANLTNEAKSGIALLQLFDATTGKSIDVETLNSKNTKNFNCKAKENVAVSWTISIPEGLQGLQYKIIAKSGNFSDGEENILPVLSNSILVTENIPLWVREKNKKEVVFENLKNNDSKTLRNHLFTLEYTSNPVWMAIQSLPYLMEYEHECAEQTFSRYYANFIAKEIISSNPKVESVFESWKKEGKTKSKIEINEELKSILLAETPWFFDADEDAKNKRLALLFDLNTLKESSEATLKKLEDKMMPSGGFPWFSGGHESRYITQHILAGLGHLDKLFPKSDTDFSRIIKKAIPYIDAKFIENSKFNKLNSITYNNTDLHYLYTRSFYLKQNPISKQVDSIIKLDLANLKKKWLDYSLYEKGMMALVMHRFNEKEFAKKIINHLKETSASNENDGMYWIDNRSGYYWYESKIETQALIIEAFAEIENDTKSIDAMKVWLIRNKQSKNWSTTKSTSEAVYALLLQGTDWTTVKDNTKFKIGNEKILSQKLSNKDKEAETGYIKMNWSASEITKEMATISVDNKSEVPGYGGVYWQYFENLEKIKSDTKGETQIQKEIFKNVTAKNGTELAPIEKESLKVGDLITIRLTIKTEVDLEYVHLKDLRASCFEPVNVISEYKWEGVSYYMSTKDVATHFFFDSIKRGTYVIDYEVRVTNSGSFNNGIATLQSMYAPEFSSHSKSDKIKIN